MNVKTSAPSDSCGALRQAAENEQAAQNPRGILNSITQQKEDASRPRGSEKKIPQKSVVKSPNFYINANGSSPEFTTAKLAADYSLVEELDEKLSDIRGQAYAVQAVKEYLFGINSRENARGVGGLMVFLGPPAVGKTVMGEKIAEALHRPFLRLDMSGYNDHEIGMCDLFGVNKSYKAAASGLLTSFVEENPVSVIMLDEFEKAHANVLNRFLQIFDRGEVRDLFSERNVSFRNVIVIVTTNLGKMLYDRSLTTYNLSDTPQAMIVQALRAEVNPQTQMPYLSGALISRLATGKIILFNRLRPEILHRIAVEEIEKTEAFYREKYGLLFQVDQNLLAKLVILSVGERADVRSVLKSVKELFARGLVRMMDLGYAERRLFTTVRCEIDLEGESAEAREVFHSRNKMRVLVCCKDAHKKLFRRYNSDEVEICFTKKDETPASMAEKDVAMAILDLEEEEKDFSLGLFKALREREVIPVYVYGTKAIQDTSLVYFLDHGATDVFRGSGKALTDWAGEILSGVALTGVAQTLFRANKVVSFETAYSFGEPQTAVLRISRIDIVLAREAADLETFVGGRQIPNVHFDEIYGAKDAKAEMLRSIEFLKDQRKYLRKGLRPPRGILLEGDPGTGKTMLAKAFAREAGLPFIQKNASEFKQALQGEGARLVRELFAAARKYAPAVVFIDEIDAIAKVREATINEGSTEALNALLSEMDGFSNDRTAPVFLIAATNFNFKKGETLLDPALLRRFERKIHLDLPDLETRRQYLTDQIAKYPNEVTARLIENLAKRSIGWSLGELDNVIQNALREACGVEAGRITDMLLNEAFECYLDGESKRRSEREMRRTAIHEAGHAVVAASLGLMPSYATIGARGDYGGYVYYGDDNATVLSREECLTRIAVMMAGRAAEMVTYGEGGMTSGASGDLKSATRLATDMLCDYGMDEEYPIHIDRGKCLEMPWVLQRITEIIRSQSARARSIVEANRETVEAVAEALLEKVNLDETDIKNLFRQRR